MFSDDDEEVSETNSVKLSVPVVPVKAPTPTNTLAAQSSSSSSTGNQQIPPVIQTQIQQLMQRPYKIYATIDDTLTASANASQLENCLNLIGFDELRDKLAELNTRLRDYYQVKNREF